MNFKNNTENFSLLRDFNPYSQNQYGLQKDFTRFCTLPLLNFIPFQMIFLFRISCLQNSDFNFNCTFSYISFKIIYLFLEFLNYMTQFLIRYVQIFSVNLRIIFTFNLFLFFKLNFILLLLSIKHLLQYFNQQFS